MKPTVVSYLYVAGEGYMLMIDKILNPDGCDPLSGVIKESHHRKEKIDQLFIERDIALNEQARMRASFKAIGEAAEAALKR